MTIPTDSPEAAPEAASVPIVVEAQCPLPPGTKNPSDQKCLAIIFNPVSGTGDPEERKSAISAALETHGYTCRYIMTTPEAGARAAAEEALADGVDLIAVSGGDGTVVEAMTALIGSHIPIAVLPAGTGNLLSVNLNLPQDAAAAVEAALQGERRQLDMAKVIRAENTGGPPGMPEEPCYFVIMSGVGYDADLIRDADRETKRRLGLLAYLFSAVKNLWRRPMLALIRLDDGPSLRRRAKSVIVANMGRFQGGVNAIPHAFPDDGLLEVVILRAESLLDWARLLFNLLRRRIEDDPSMEFHPARKVEVTLSAPQVMQFDGEIAEQPSRHYTIEVMPQAIEVMVPPTAPAVQEKPAAG